MAITEILLIWARGMTTCPTPGWCQSVSQGSPLQQLLSAITVCWLVGRHQPQADWAVIGRGPVSCRTRETVVLWSKIILQRRNWRNTQTGTLSPLSRLYWYSLKWVWLFCVSVEETSVSRQMFYRAAKFYWKITSIHITPCLQYFPFRLTERYRIKWHVGIFCNLCCDCELCDGDGVQSWEEVKEDKNKITIV